MSVNSPATVPFRTTFHGVSRLSRHVGETWFGEPAAQATVEACRQLGAKKILAVVDAGISEQTQIQELLEALKKEKYPLHIFARVTPSPTDVFIDEALEVARVTSPDTILGLGGGSTLDTAKAVQMLLANPGSCHDYLMNGGRKLFDTKPSARLVLVPTTAGSGAELTLLSAVFNTREKCKDNLPLEALADIIILDPRLTLSCSRFFAYCAAMDGMSHACERLTNVRNNPHGNMIAGQCIRWIWRNLRRGILDNDLDARGLIMLGAHYCMDFSMEYGGARANLNHAVAGALGYRFHLDHGHAVALALPFTLAFMARSGKADAACVRIAEEMGIRQEIGLHPGLSVAKALLAMNDAIGLPGLEDKGVCPEEMAALVSHIIGPWRMRVENALAVPDSVELQEILLGIFTQRLELS